MKNRIFLFASILLITNSFRLYSEPVGYTHPWDSIEVRPDFLNIVLRKYKLKRSQKVTDFPLLDSEISLVNNKVFSSIN